MQESRQYDADGRLAADVYAYAATATASYTTADGTFSLPIGGWLVSATTYYYNADGEVTATYDYGRDTSSPNYWNSIYNGTVNADQEAIPAAPPPLTTAPDGTLGAAEGAGYGVLTLQSDVVHWGPNGEAGYDAEGHALNYQYTRPNVETVAYQVQYLKQDGYLEASTTGTSPQLVKTTDTSYYDAFGRRVAIDTHSANAAIPDQVRAFACDAEGQILERRDGSVGNNGAGTFSVTANGGYATQHYAYVGGQQIGSVDEAGTIDVLSGVTGFSNTDQGSSDYVAQAGDTMQSIAQAVYGDASLWYVVADANGFESATDAPAAGQSLKLPEVTTNSNTAETFKPYNPHEISGSTTPALPTAPQPPPSAQGCNALAEIIVIAVAVIVSVASYGALAGESATFAESVLAGAAAGAAGSAAGQLAGDALGTQNGFDWGQVAVGAVGGAIGGAVASKLVGANAFARGATEGAASYVGTYETDKLVGEPAHFSWAGLVANAVGSGAAAEIGPTAAERKAGITSGTLAEKIEANAVQDVVTRETSVALGDNHVQSWQQIGEDVFGNALGNAAIAGINHYEAIQQVQDQIAALNKDQRYAFNIFKQDGASDGQALQRALLFGKVTDRPLDATNPTFSNLSQADGSFGSAVDASFWTAIGQNTGAFTATNIGFPEAGSPFDSTQNIAFWSAFNQKIEKEGFVAAAADAEDIAGLVPIKQRVDALNQTLAGMSTSDPNYAALHEMANAISYALVNEDVYFDTSIPQILPEGIQRLTAQQIAQTPLSALTPSMLVDAKSGFYSAVYQQYETSGGSTFVIADRGTDQLVDWKANFAQGFGLDAKQYDEAARVANLVTQSNVQDVMFTGHSLGGGLAALQSLITGMPAYTYNAAGLSQATLGREHATYANEAGSLIHAYNVDHELLSTLQDDTPFILPSAEGTRTGLTPVSFDDTLPNSEAPQPWHEDFNPAIMLRQHADVSVLHALNYRLSQLYGTLGD